ncbi:Oidioi.mRNA.OKI2018_I69.chr2.g5402.t1.cds [Oikopleura dioica]|uniref:Oidioi.mRNA.OKI2018_I69.chr2.g5402.t1.cds n=1 Tax=Oikopleura dioica TaxID=34765 RepID=A0ABN7T0B6_OIKDI|nr:Oidioi.mRNA.OKI2018_I69.chr2.g5402.t1.cds [Oikopleura dioica]
MNGIFLKAEMRFIEKNFTGPELKIKEFLNEEEYTAIEKFEGNFRRLTRSASSYLSLNYRRYSSKMPVPWNKTAVSETLELTKPYTSDRDCYLTTKSILENMALPLRFKLDFWFLSSSTKKTEDGSTIQYEIVYPNQRSAINDTVYIASKADAEELLEECSDSTIFQKLLESHHLDLMAFKSSGVSVSRLLAMSITITKTPAVPDFKQSRAPTKQLETAFEDFNISEESDNSSIDELIF